MRTHDLTNKKTNIKKKDKDNKKTKKKTCREHLQRAILETCDLCDIWSEWWGHMIQPTKRQRQIHLDTYDLWHIVYNSDNWEPEFMTVFVNWQLRVTVDSIRNSCDVYTKPFKLTKHILNYRFEHSWASEPHEPWARVTLDQLSLISHSDLYDVLVSDNFCHYYISFLGLGF